MAKFLSLESINWVLRNSNHCLVCGMHALFNNRKNTCMSFNALIFSVMLIQYGGGSNDIRLVWKNDRNIKYKIKHHSDGCLDYFWFKEITLKLVYCKEKRRK